MTVDSPGHPQPFFFPPLFLPLPRLYCNPLFGLPPIHAASLINRRCVFSSSQFNLSTYQVFLTDFFPLFQDLGSDAFTASRFSGCPPSELEVAIPVPSSPHLGTSFQSVQSIRRTDLLFSFSQGLPASTRPCAHFFFSYSPPLFLFPQPCIEADRSSPVLPTSESASQLI